METLSFTLGVLTVIILILVVGAFWVAKTAMDTRNQAENIQRDFDNIVHDIYRDISQLKSDLKNEINKVEEHGIRHTDSRVDKLEAKIYSEFKTHRS